jgi:multidrug efflux pump subunit AcrA (membrane-fusion protein)
MIAERGTLESARFESIICEVPGNSTILSLVPEGSRVDAGDVVAELDSAALRDRLTNQAIATRQAESDYNNAKLAREVDEIEVKEYENGIYPQQRNALAGQVIIAEQSVSLAADRLARAKTAQKRVSEIARSGGAQPKVSAPDISLTPMVSGAQLALNRAQAAAETVKRQKELLETYGGPTRMKELRTAVEKALSDEQTSRARWETEKGKEEKLKHDIESCSVRSPIEGYVAYANEPARQDAPERPTIVEGATVRERQVIALVIDPSSPLRVNVKIPEVFINRVGAGQKATVKVDAIAGRVFHGTIREVAPTPDPAAYFNSDVKAYTTLVDIDDGIPGLRPGMSALVEIPVVVLPPPPEDR